MYILIDQCLQDISHNTLRPTEQCLIPIPAMMKASEIVVEPAPPAPDIREK